MTEGAAQAELGHRLPGRPHEGVFARWVWDGRALTVSNDRYGFYPLFYFCQDGQIGVSPSIVPLVPRLPSKALDDDALAVFLRLGCFLGDATPFARIKALPPGATLTWDGGAPTLRGGFVMPRPLQITRPEATDRFIALVREAVQRRPPPDGGALMPLSGGRDSRHILLALLECGYRPAGCVTHEPFPTKPQDDVGVARQLTKALGLPHTVVPQDQPWFAGELRKNRLTSFCSDEHVHALVLADYLAGKTTAVYDGIAGMLAESFLLNPAHMALYTQQRYDDLAAGLIRMFGVSEQVLGAVVHPALMARLGLAGATTRVAEELSRHADAPNPIAAFHFWNRTRREISLIPYGILAHVPVVYAPYLDHALCEFLLALPEDVVRDGTFSTQAIRRGYPQVAHIPFAEQSAPGPAMRLQLQRFTSDFLRHHLRRGFGVLRSRLVNGRFVLPRLLRGLADPAYQDSLSWVARSPMAYLIQLEELAQGPGI